MPYCAVKSRQRHLYDLLKRNLLVLIALLLVEDPVRIEETGSGKRGRFTFADFDAQDRSHRKRARWVTDLADYGAVYGQLCGQRSKRHKVPSVRRRLRATDFSDAEFRCRFRFERSEFKFLLSALRIPEMVRTASRRCFTGEEALLLYLDRWRVRCCRSRFWLLRTLQAVFHFDSQFRLVRSPLPAASLAPLPSNQLLRRAHCCCCCETHCCSLISLFWHPALLCWLLALFLLCCVVLTLLSSRCVVLLQLLSYQKIHDCLELFDCYRIIRVIRIGASHFILG